VRIKRQETVWITKLRHIHHIVAQEEGNQISTKYDASSMPVYIELTVGLVILAIEIFKLVLKSPAPL
jgi:hypothetical protein